MKKNIILFYNKLHNAFGGMEIHGDNFIKHYSKNPKFNLIGIVSKGEDNNNYLIQNNEVGIIDFTKTKLNVDILFFNSGHWIEELESLKRIFKNSNFIYRTGGNEIIKAPLQNKTINQHSFRQKYWVNILNNNINYIVTNSSYTEQRLLKIGIEPKLFFRNVGGVNVKSINQVNRVSKKTSVQFVCASRFVEYKNHRLLLSIFNTLDKLNIDFELILIGNGDLYSEIKDFVSLKKLNNKVVFLNEKTNQEVLKYIINTDYYIQLSSEYKKKVEGGSYIHAEGMGRTILEAICCETFIITSKKGAIPELINEHNGVLLDINNKKEIISVLSDLIKNKKTVKNFNNEIYSWETYFKNYDSLFNGF